MNTVRKANFSSKEFDINLKKIKNIHLYQPSKIPTLTNLPEEFIHDGSDIHYHLLKNGSLRYVSLYYFADGGKDLTSELINYILIILKDRNFE